MNKSALFINLALLIASTFFSCQTKLQKQHIPIVAWYGPSVYSLSQADLLSVRQAGFTSCIINLQNSEANNIALAFADSIGLQLFITDESIKKFVDDKDSVLYHVDSTMQRYRRHPSFQGALLYDKPSTANYEKLAVLTDYFQSKIPDVRYFIQCLPNYASPVRLDTTDYIGYLSRFEQTLHPQILSVEHMGILKEGLRSEFFPNLAVLRQVSLAAKTPFWAYALAVPFGDHPAVLHSHIRTQLYSGLAYGAKGVQYYSFLPPNNRSQIFGDALKNNLGEFTKLYRDVQSINAEISRIGPTIMELQSTAVCFSKPIPPGGHGFSPGLPIVSIDAPTMLAGFFQDKKGESYFLLVNTDMDYGKLARVTFAEDVKSVIEIAKNKMPAEEFSWQKEESEKDAVLLFRAGDGRLFKVLRKK